MAAHIYAHTFKKTIAKLLKNVNVKSAEETDIKHMLNLHIDALCFNITAILCVLAMINDGVVDKKVMKELVKYIRHNCKDKGAHAITQDGGGSMASEYFGYDYGRYSSGNEMAGVTTTGTVDFAAGIQRAGLGPSQEGGGPTHKIGVLYDTIIKEMVGTIIERNNVSISPKLLKNFMHIINIHLHCLKADLDKHAAAAAQLTLAKFKGIIKLKRHAVFN